MGNIVSNAVPFGQTTRSPGDVVLATQTFPSVNSQSPVITVTNPNVIEAVGQTGQGGAYHTDPFGTLPPSQQTNQQSGESGETELPSIPTVPPPASDTPPSITPEVPVPQPEPPITQPENTTPDPRQGDVVALFSQMPDIFQMMKDLEKSGCLLPELQIKSTERVDTSPLAALQPQRLKDQRFFSAPSDQPQTPQLPDVKLTETGAVKHPAQFAELPMFVFVSLIAFIQSVQGFAQVAHFGLITYPQYEQMVISTQLTTTDVNATVIKALIIAGLAVFSILMGLILLVKRAKNHSILIYGVVALIVLNFFTQNMMARKEFASGNPLVLPEILGEVISKAQAPR
jgi:hypothetical protein